jgi:hypothetical protein
MNTAPNSTQSSAAKPAPVRRAPLRFTATTIVGAYAVINRLLALVTPLTPGWPLPALTAVVVPPMVLAMIHLVIPLARKVG